MTLTVENQPDQSRYALLADGELIGVAEYDLRDDAIVFTHTEVFEAFERELEAVPGVADVVRALRWPTCVASSGEHERMRRTPLALDSQIQKEESSQKQLKSAIDTLRYDTNAVERLAREKLHYAKPGETVVVFESATNHSIR